MMRSVCLISTLMLLVFKPEAGAEVLQFLSGGSDSDQEVYLQKAWTSFKIRHAKIYSGVDEEQRRRQIFSDSLKTIENHNRLYESGRSSYKMGINQFSDMEFSEIMAMNGHREDNETDGYDDEKYEESFSSISEDAVPKYIDWRRKGYVTGVKNQGHCGSCWAFSATGALEGQVKKKTGRLVSLSEQNLIDCSRPQGNFGCRGGLSRKAFDYIKKNNGIDTESSYPYKGKDESCHYRARYRGATDRGYVNIKRGSEAALTKAIATVGPIAVSIHVVDSFRHYEYGIYEDPFCNRMNSNHAVLVVGYGSLDGKDYYTVKNSWGTRWGERGYIKITRGNCNMCGIATKAVYPIV